MKKIIIILSIYLSSCTKEVYIGEGRKCKENNIQMIKIETERCENRILERTHKNGDIMEECQRRVLQHYCE